MDPTRSYSLMIDAYNRNDVDEALGHAEEVTRALAEGLAPAGMSLGWARRRVQHVATVCRNVIKARQLHRERTELG